MRGGKWYAEYACFWIANNPDDWKKLRRIVLRAANDGHKIQQGEIVTLAREQGVEFSNVPDFKRDRNLWPALARYMTMLRPSLCKSIDFRESCLDHVDMEAIWREHVNAGTFFLAHDREEALGLCDMDDASAS